MLTENLVNEFLLCAKHAIVETPSLLLTPRRHSRLKLWISRSFFGVASDKTAESQNFIDRCALLSITVAASAQKLAKTFEPLFEEPAF
jgi:hypothetical protein